MPLPKQTNRGVKRRRQDDKELEDDKEAALRRKLHHTLKELRRVIKKARAFEVQKTLKKLKDARRKDPESGLTKDLGLQMEVLKHLSYDQLAHSALLSKLKKSKLISADPTIQAISAEMTSTLVPLGTPGTPTAKVQGRILSCKLLAVEVVSIVNSLRAFLDLSIGTEVVQKSAHNPPRSPENLKRRKTVVLHEKDASSPRHSDTNLSDQTSHGGHEGVNNDGAMVEVDDGWESGRVGGPSDSDDSAAGLAGDHVGETSDQGKSNGPLSGNRKSRPHRSEGQSEFLPSLSVGFIRGDSGSELSDSETGSDEGIKKNRRGQRARRAIWEKKFGKNANHVKSRQETSRRRLYGSIPLDRRTGKGSSISGPRPTPARSRAHTHDHEQIRRPRLPVSERVNDFNDSGGARRDNGSDLRRREDRLHPSWEAKKKHKTASIVPSRGTKIVFSDP